MKESIIIQALPMKEVKPWLLLRHYAHRGIKSRYLKTCDSLDLMPYHAMNEDEALNLAEFGKEVV